MKELNNTEKQQVLGAGGSMTEVIKDVLERLSDFLK